ncbi:MAG TPA: hypothetical protein VF905_05360, partial [Nitrospirota bacterium]
TGQLFLRPTMTVSRTVEEILHSHSAKSGCGSDYGIHEPAGGGEHQPRQLQNNQNNGTHQAEAQCENAQ